jgi:hypothetical protein
VARIAILFRALAQTLELVLELVQNYRLIFVPDAESACMEVVDLATAFGWSPGLIFPPI